MEIRLAGAIERGPLSVGTAPKENYPTGGFLSGIPKQFISGLWNQGVYSRCDTRESPPLYGVCQYLGSQFCCISDLVISHNPASFQLTPYRFRKPWIKRAPGAEPAGSPGCSSQGPRGDGKQTQRTTHRGMALGGTAGFNIVAI